MGRRACDEDEFFSGLEPGASIEVVVTDNPVIGLLYGPKGDVLAEVHERSASFGFVAGRRFNA